MDYRVVIFSISTSVERAVLISYWDTDLGSDGLLEMIRFIIPASQSAMAEQVQIGTRDSVPYDFWSPKTVLFRQNLKMYHGFSVSAVLGLHVLTWRSSLALPTSYHIHIRHGLPLTERWEDPAQIALLSNPHLSCSQY